MSRSGGCLGTTLPSLLRRCRTRPRRGIARCRLSRRRAVCGAQRNRTCDLVERRQARQVAALPEGGVEDLTTRSERIKDQGAQPGRARHPPYSGSCLSPHVAVPAPKVSSAQHKGCLPTGLSGHRQTGLPGPLRPLRQDRKAPRPIGPRKGLTGASNRSIGLGMRRPC